MASVRRRIAPATLISPFLTHSVGEEGGPGGDGAGSPHPQPLSRAAGEGEELVRERSSVDRRRIAPATLIFPLPRPQRGRGRGARGDGEGFTPPFLAHSVGAEGGWGDGEGGHHFLSPILPLITPSATFSNQTNLIDLHRFINRFTHVIDGKRRNAYRRQCFHLDTSLALAAYRCLNL